MPDSDFTNCKIQPGIRNDGAAKIVIASSRAGMWGGRSDPKPRSLFKNF
jgi:hypothetical protein